MFLQERFDFPALKLLRSENLEFIMGFFYGLFRNPSKEVDVIKQIQLEKELELFIGEFNKNTRFEDKKETNARNYVEFWIKNQFLRRVEIGAFEDDYNIELSESSLLVMNFIDNLGIKDEYLHASVKSDFENAIHNLKSISFSNEAYKKQNLLEIDRQIKELEKKKSLIQKGDLRVFEEEVYDKYTSAREILKKMPTNFRKVETVFENIYGSIQKRSNEIDINRGDILGFTLDEIDEKINNSPQGRSFDGFEKFFRERNNELFATLEKVFENFDKIQVLEKQKSLKSLMNNDLFKAKKRAYNKKTFIVSKLQEIFNEENQKDRKIGLDLLKQIKKTFTQNSKNCNYKSDLWEIKNGFDIDLFLGKNMWEQPNILRIAPHTETVVEKEEVNVENIFRYTSLSEKQIRDRIVECLQGADEILVDRILEVYPVQYGVDEFMTYMKVALAGAGTVRDTKKHRFEITGIHNNLEVESGEVRFIKGW